MLPTEAHADITRYLAHGWEWRVIAGLINKKYGLGHSLATLRRLYGSAKKPPSVR